MRIIIKHLSGRDVGRKHIFPVRRLLIGRDGNCDLRFDLQRDLEVSGRHAEIIPRRTGEVEIADLDSTNGLLINGKVVKRSLLKSGDQIELGSGGPRLLYELRRAHLRSLVDLLLGRGSPRGEP